MMNKKGSMFFAVIVAIMIFMIGVLYVHFIKQEVTQARGTSGLSCSTGGISDGNKLTCLFVDTVLPYFILLFLSVAGGAIAEKLTL
jgi:low temperature requirement protein LtrA